MLRPALRVWRLRMPSKLEANTPVPQLVAAPHGARAGGALHYRPLQRGPRRCRRRTRSPRLRRERASHRAHRANMAGRGGRAGAINDLMCVCVCVCVYARARARVHVCVWQLARLSTPRDVDGNPLPPPPPPPPLLRPPQTCTTSW